MLRLFIILTIFSLSLTSQEKDNWIIDDIRISGLQRVSAGSVFAVMPIGLGDEINSSKFKEIALSIFETGKFDAIILAMAGIKRLGLDVAHSPIDPAIMPSAVAQGALAAQIRTPFDERSAAVKEVVSELSCYQSLTEVTAERALLAYLDGSCQTPIAASARLQSNHLLALDGMILSKDGQAAYRFEMEAPAGDAEALGKAVGIKLLEMAGGRDFLA